MDKNIIKFINAQAIAKATFASLSQYMDVSQWRAKVQEAQQQEAEAFRDLMKYLFEHNSMWPAAHDIKFSWEK